MQKTVILGGGFAGLSFALNLEKKIKKNSKIILIDKNPYHLFTGNLYEIASAAEELVSINELKKSITLPFSEILQSKKIEFINSEVKEVNTQEKILSISGKKLFYDYLIIAEGSEPEYFNIPGAKSFGLPLKNFSNALKIKNDLEFAVERHKYDSQKKYVRVLIAGGGYTGIELATEIKGVMDFLSWKHNYPRERIEIEIIEASGQLMAGMGEIAVSDVKSRLKYLGIRFRLLSPITSVNANVVELFTGERIVYDCLIWAAGVRARLLPLGVGAKTDSRGRVETDKFLRVLGFENIFTIGDQALILNNNGKPVPPSAQDAIDQAEYLSNALPILMQNQLPKEYKPKNHGFIVSLGGRWAILNYPPFYFTGWVAYFIHALAHVRYFASLIGWWKAFKLVCFQDKIYSRND